MTRLFCKGYTKSVSKVLPIKDETSLEETLNKDVFLQSAIKEVFIPLYYKWGTFLAPLTVAVNTAAHIDYQFVINGTNQESEEKSQGELEN